MDNRNFSKSEKALNAYQSNDLESASMIYEELIKEESMSPDHYNMLAVTLMRRSLETAETDSAVNYLHRAKDLLEYALKLSPGVSQYHFNYGLLLSRVNDPRALEEFKKSVQLEPANPEYQIELIKMLFSMKLYNDTFLLLEHASSELNGNPVIDEIRFCTMKYLGKTLEAGQCISNLNIDRLSYDGLLSLAEYYYEKDELSKSYEIFLKLLSEMPDKQTLLISMLNLFTIKKQSGICQDIFFHLESSVLDDTSRKLDLAEALVSSDLTHYAVRIYQEIISGSPNLAEPYMGLALISKSEGLYHKYKEYMELAVSMAENKAVLLYNLANTAFMSEDNDAFAYFVHYEIESLESDLKERVVSVRDLVENSRVPIVFSPKLSDNLFFLQSISCFVKKYPKINFILYTNGEFDDIYDELIGTSYETISEELQLSEFQQLLTLGSVAADIYFENSDASKLYLKEKITGRHQLPVSVAVNSTRYSESLQNYLQENQYQYQILKQTKVENSFGAFNQVSDKIDSFQIQFASDIFKLVHESSCVITDNPLIAQFAGAFSVPTVFLQSNSTQWYFEKETGINCAYDALHSFSSTESQFSLKEVLNQFFKHISQIEEVEVQKML